MIFPAKAPNLLRKHILEKSRRACPHMRAARRAAISEAGQQARQVSNIGIGTVVIDKVLGAPAAAS